MNNRPRFNARILDVAHREDEAQQNSAGAGDRVRFE
jgi:hypothetical protein